MHHHSGEQINILAVVVTYNRCALLKKCIDYIEKQRCQCDILLIDNASNDQTRAYAEERRSQHFIYLRMDENLGGAGGFYTGIRWGIEHDYDYLWIMDDDCQPANDALEQLIYADKQLSGKYGWLSSLCRWTDGELCAMNIQMKTPFRAISDFSEDIIPAQMASFVSLLIKAETIIDYGYPIAEFVIWSDDWEFTRRISKSLPCYVVKNSVVVHAMKNNTIVSIAKDNKERLKRYKYFYRNDVYLYRREGIKGWLWVIAKDCWHALQSIISGHPSRIRYIIYGFIKGLHFYPSIERCNRVNEDGTC